LRDGEVLLCLVALIGLPIELAEAEVAVSDEGAHAEFIGQRHRRSVLLFRRRGVDGFGPSRNLPCEMEGIRLDGPLALLASQGKRPLSLGGRLVCSASEQVGLSQCCTL